MKRGDPDRFPSWRRDGTRERIAATEFRYEDYSIAVSCSFGVAELDPEFKQPKELYDSADGALFESKRGGRGRVTVVGENESPTAEV